VRLAVRWGRAVPPVCKAPPGWLLRRSTARKAGWAMLLGQGPRGRHPFCKLTLQAPLVGREGPGTSGLFSSRELSVKFNLELSAGRAEVP
jgi:hypothetical protein